MSRENNSSILCFLLTKKANKLFCSKLKRKLKLKHLTYQRSLLKRLTSFVSPSQVHLVQLLDLYGSDAKYNGERFVFITTTTATLGACSQQGAPTTFVCCVSVLLEEERKEQMMICIIDLKRIVSLLPIAAGNLDFTGQHWLESQAASGRKYT